MGNPVVHFAVIGRDGAALKSFYGELFDWKIDDNNEMGYGTISREGNAMPDGSGIGGGVSQGPAGYEGHVTFYVEVPDIEEHLKKAESLGAERIFGPDEVFPGLVLGQFKDPEGHVIGLVKTGGAEQG